MSDTPRTDAKWDECFATIARDTVRFREFAAQLERENNELRASNDRMFKINEGLLAENAKMGAALRDIINKADIERGNVIELSDIAREALA